jgi:hypothetical protein
MASILERRDNLAGALGFLQGAEGMEADLALVYPESARLRYRMGQADAARERLVKARHLLPEAHPLARPVRELLAAIDRPAVKAGK